MGHQRGPGITNAKRSNEAKEKAQLAQLAQLAYCRGLGKRRELWEA
eukprot:gene11333-8058_t